MNPNPDLKAVLDTLTVDTFDKYLTALGFVCEGNLSLTTLTRYYYSNPGGAANIESVIIRPLLSGDCRWRDSVALITHNAAVAIFYISRFYAQRAAERGELSPHSTASILAELVAIQNEVTK